MAMLILEFSIVAYAENLSTSTEKISETKNLEKWLE